jgi:hypothetical protein
MASTPQYDIPDIAGIGSATAATGPTADPRIESQMVSRTKPRARQA